MVYSIPEQSLAILPSLPYHLRVLPLSARLVRVEQLLTHLRLVLPVRRGTCGRRRRERGGFRASGRGANLGLNPSERSRSGPTRRR